VVTRARAALEAAYAPYSRFPVGAALETDDGRVYAGANVENASYGLTLCAERVAVGQAIADGARRFVRLVVASTCDPPAAPCGACRQVLSEFGVELRVEAISIPSGQRRSWQLAELLPERFGPEDLAT